MRKSLFTLLLVSSFAIPLLTAAQTITTMRPMTFEDMMHMKRLGETAVSKDGRWLAYSVTTVNLDQNTKTAELWLQKIEGPSSENVAPIKLTVAQPGDSDPQFAPDGHSILFVSGRQNGQQIWLADFDAETGATSNARALTSIATEADNAIWSPDGHSVLFTSAVYPDCPPITAADFDTGDKSGAPADGSSSAGWKCNADRDKALADSKVKAQIFTHSLYRHWNHFTGDKRSHLFLVSVDTGAIRDLNPGDTHDVPPFSLEESGCECAFAPDSKELAFTEKQVPDEAISTNADIFTLDLTDPAAKPVKVSTSPGGDFDPAYSPDGKWLAWRSQARAGYESDRFRLMLYDRTAKMEKELLEGARLPNMEPVKFDKWIEEFAWEEDSRYIDFVSDSKGSAVLYGIGIQDRDLHPYENVRGEWGDIHTTPTRGHGDEWIIGSLMSVSLPPEVFVLDQDKAAGLATEYIPRQLTHLNDDLLAQLDLPKMESFWFTAKDGSKLEGFLIRPPGFDATKKYPVKFLIHGGPEGNWGDSWSYRWNAELFAANGYVVIMINMRGSTGYGQAIVDGVNGDWGGKPFTDLMEGLDYAEQHYPFIDKTRECALGASYGGYMANWVLGHTDRFKCIVSHDGMFSPESAYGSTEELWFNEWEFKGKPWDYYGKPNSENPYRKWSPALSAKNFKTPTLVIHGQLDYRLDVSEGFQLFDTLQRLGVPSKMLYFPDEGHWVLKPQNSQLWYKTVNDWVDEWTRTGTEGRRDEGHRDWGLGVGR